MGENLVLVHFDCQFEQDGDSWIALSERFGFAGCGDSKDAALENLRHSIRAYMRAMKRLGILEDVLKERGIPCQILESTPQEGQLAEVV